MSNDNPATAPVECVRIQADKRTTKRFSFNPFGEIENEAAVQPATGWYHRVKLPGAAPLATLAPILTKLGPNECIATGSPTFPGDTAALTTQAQAAKGKQGITRTKGWARNAPGEPALACLDIDLKDLKDDLRRRVEHDGGAWKVLCSVFPALGASGRLLRPSCSTGVYDQRTGKPARGGGLHVYVVAMDGGDTQDFAKRLRDHLVLAGWGFAFVTKAGQIKIRSLIDVDASGDPERLVFEADAVLEQGLAYKPDARKPVVELDGRLLDTRALAALDKDQRDRLADIERALTADPDTQQRHREARDKWIEEQIARQVSKGIVLKVAQERAQRAAVNADMGLLDLDLSVRLDCDDGSGGQEWVECRDMLCDPDAYDGRTGSDPLEPDYGGGRNKAIWWTNPDGSLGCSSHAHGGQNFTLALDVPSVIETWKAETDKGSPDARKWLRETWSMARWSPDPDVARREFEQVVRERVPLSGGLDFALVDYGDGHGTVTLGDVEALVNAPEEARDVDALRGLHTALGSIFDDYVTGLHAAGAIKEPLPIIEGWLRPRAKPSSSSPDTGMITLAVLEHLVIAALMWIVPGYIPEGLTILAGRPKIGKSWLVLALALAVAMGTKVLGVDVKKGAVLYCGLEDGQRRMQDRVRKILGPTAKGWPANFYFRQCLPPLD
jgi:hypothetical protein